MRAVLQRVLRASVTVDGALIGAIEGGLLVYLGIAPDDTEAEVEWFARKVSEMRIFEGAGDREGQMDRAASEAGGAVLVVSQFTLYADTRKGRRPSFVDAAPPEVAAPLIERCMDALRTRGLRVVGGRFGAHMLVDAVNDGPVTIILDSEEMGRPRRG